MIALGAHVATPSMNTGWSFTAAVVRIGGQPVCGFRQAPIDLQSADEGQASTSRGRRTRAAP